MCGKCGQQNHDDHIYESHFPCKCANCGSNHPVYARSCESWRQDNEILTVKHQNYIPYSEAHKLIVGSKTTIYSQAVQRNKSSHKKYETIVKTLIQLEPGDWESFINKIKASLDTYRAADTSTTLIDLAENKEESSAQIQTQLGKTDPVEKTAITPKTRSIKRPVTKSNKTRSKDKRYPIRPHVSTDSSSNKKQRQTKNYTQTKNTRNRKYKSNKLRIFEKMVTESSPQLLNPKPKRINQQTAQTKVLIMNH